MQSRKTLFTIGLLVFLLASCRGRPDPLTAQTATSAAASSDPVMAETSPPGAAETQAQAANQESRALLTYDDLIHGFEYTGPVQEIAFATPESAKPAALIFEGRLALIGEDSIGNYNLVRGDPPLEEELYHLPEFDFEFVQDGGYLIPVQRGRIVTEHPVWNYILGPGRVWQEPGDQDYVRASFPFTLVPKGGNSTYSGTMMFLFKDDAVSKAWYQITQETSFNMRFDSWGLLEAAYQHQPVPQAAAIKAAFADELAHRYPTQPIETLTQKYPDVDLSAFGRGLTPAHLNSYGFIVQGINYVSGCSTRYGPYTYCDWMRYASWSTAKSAFAGVAMMRLAQEFGPAASQILIRDYVPEAADAPGDWSLVTLDNTLDMATGNYASARWMQDEENFDSPFWVAEDYAGMIMAAFDWPSSAVPGTQWVYHTSDTFIAVAAMQNYLKEQSGAEADIFQYVVNEVYIPIDIGPGAHTSARTSDNDWNGLAFGGSGLWWIQDDIAKIADLLHNNGAANGVQILDQRLVSAALQKDVTDRGVRISSREMYNNGFWSTRYGETQQYTCEFWVAEMQGISGVVVVLMPNGTTYYYFSDNQEFTWDHAVRESDKIIPFCSSE